METHHFQQNHLNLFWPPDLEENFCKLLLQYSGTKSLGDDYEALLLMPDIARELQVVSGHEVTLEIVKLNYYNLKEHHESFKLMMLNKDIHYCESTNKIIVPASVEKELIEQMPFCENYFLLGESRWPYMKGIFGWYDEIRKNERVSRPAIHTNLEGACEENPVILSDSKPPTKPIINAAAGPQRANRTYVCQRKLFDEVEEVGDNGCGEVVWQSGDKYSAVGQSGEVGNRIHRREQRSSTSNNASDASTRHSCQRPRLN